MSDLTFTTENTAAGPRVALAGHLDHHTAGRLRETLSTLALNPGQRLVLDLGGLTFCDSTGITAFLVARNHALSARADMGLTEVPATIGRILHIIGLDQVFSIDPGAARTDAP